MSNFIYQLSEDSDFLMYHGIKGQKWGEQNGPPYPLDDAMSTGTKLKYEKLTKDTKNEKENLLNNIRILRNEVDKYNNQSIMTNGKFDEEKYDKINKSIDDAMYNFVNKTGWIIQSSGSSGDTGDYSTHYVVSNPYSGKNYMAKTIYSDHHLNKVINEVVEDLDDMFDYYDDWDY